MSSVDGTSSANGETPDDVGTLLNVEFAVDSNDRTSHTDVVTSLAFHHVTAAADDVELRCICITSRDVVMLSPP